MGDRNSNHRGNSVIPGHEAVTHILSSISSPVQFMPPYKGPTHVLFRHCVPFAHVTEQIDQSAQAVHTPSTINIIVVFYYNMYSYITDYC